MKQHFVSFSNCQGGAILHFLKKTRLVDHFRFTQVNNWQIILGEQPRDLLYESLRTADVLFYQPTGEFHCVDKEIVPPVDKLIAEFVPKGALKIAWAYQFNHGFFPFLNVGPGADGWIVSREIRKWIAADRVGFFCAYDDGPVSVHYDCALRFVECLAEQSRREQECDIRMVPFILQNFAKHRLFLTQNHPTSFLLTEMAVRVYGRLGYDLPGALEAMRTDNPNEANLPGTLAVHPAVVEELGLRYPADTDLSQFDVMVDKMIVDISGTAPATPLAPA